MRREGQVRGMKCAGAGAEGGNPARCDVLEDGGP
jgi:hypothetical protein